MKLTEKQTAVLKAMTAEWQTPTQIAGRLPKSQVDHDWAPLYGSSYVNQPIKSLMRAGWVETNPDKRGQYRLTTDGAARQNALK